MALKKLDITNDSDTTEYSGMCDKSQYLLLWVKMFSEGTASECKEALGIPYPM